MSLPIKVALIDDQHLFRTILATTLEVNDNSINIIQESASGNAFLVYLDSNGQLPDIAIVDMSMPDMNGMELTKRLHMHYPEIKIIILSINYRNQLIARTIGMGASAYLSKNCDVSTLKLAIQSVHYTGFYMDSATVKALQNRYEKKEKGIQSAAESLTNRELEILNLICQELSNAEIADKLFLSVRTIEGHRNNLLLKTGCKNTAGLVIFAIKHRIFDVLS